LRRGPVPSTHEKNRWLALKVQVKQDFRHSNKAIS
jgi:hypothetical protein